jgi:xyloglucan-specific endo-beta-1,4-glucanase
MFLDADPHRAMSTTKAAFEIMIWQAAYGGMRPVGWTDVTADAPTVQLDGTT